MSDVDTRSGQRVRQEILHHGGSRKSPDGTFAKKWRTPLCKQSLSVPIASRDHVSAAARARNSRLAICSDHIFPTRQ